MEEKGQLESYSLFDCLGVLNHVGADFSAVTTGNGAITAVLHVGMFFAFLGAAVADAFAKLTKLFREFAVKTHHLSGGVAECSAFEVELDAAGHAFYVFFEKTGAGTLQTEGGAGSAGFYTFLILVL